MLEAVYLYLILHDDGSSGERFRYKMPSMVACENSLNAARISAPTNVGGDYEAISVMFCANEDQQGSFGGDWVKRTIR